MHEGRMGSVELDPKPTGRRWRLHQSAMVVLWVVVSLTIWAGLHWHIRRLSMRKAEEGLVSMCDERARMLQDRFTVSVNHVHALAILVSTFHYQKEPPALDQVYLISLNKPFYSEIQLLSIYVYFGNSCLCYLFTNIQDCIKSICIR